jgi:hypothetical protein
MISRGGDCSASIPTIVCTWVTQLLGAGGVIPGTAELRAGGPNDPSSGSGLSSGAVAGIAIGAALGGILLAAGGFVMYVRSKKSRFDEFKQSPASPSGDGECQEVNAGCAHACERCMCQHLIFIVILPAGANKIPNF